MTQLVDTVRETAFLEILDGAGGAPRVLATCPRTGCYFMSYLGAENLADLLLNQLKGDEKFDDMFWLLVIENVIYKLIDVHKKRVVHADFKANNVMIDRSDPTRPTAAIIDFGLSTLHGQPWPRNKNMNPTSSNKVLARCKWYAYETVFGLPLTYKTDVVGMSHLIRQIVGVMVRKPRQLHAIAKRGMSRDLALRPTMQELLYVTRDVIQHRRCKTASGRPKTEV